MRNLIKPFDDNQDTEDGMDNGEIKFEAVGLLG